jgi:metal-responsive CopG/Arc/MetJ family transcriptional regulator
MSKKTKIIQVPMPEDLVAKLDYVSQQQERSRSALLREAAAQYISRLDEAEKVKQYVEGYERYPEDEDDVAWAEMGAQELARTLAEDEW